MRLAWSISLITLAGCGGVDQVDPGSTDTEATTSGTSGTASSTGGFDIDTTPWAETEAPPTGGAGLDTGSTGSEPVEEESDDDGPEDETFVGMFGFGPSVPGESYAPEGEMVAVVDKEDECLIEWTASAVPDDTCSECEFAFRLTLETLEVIEDVACEDYGLPTADVGASFGIGVFEEELFFEDGRGWEWVEGYGEYIPERGVFEWELELEP